MVKKKGKKKELLLTAKDIRNLLWFALLVLKFLSPSNMYYIYIYIVKSHKLKEKKRNIKYWGVISELT